MIDQETLNLLRCPETHAGLKLADEALLVELNRQIEAGKLKNRAGKPVDEPLDGGLLREDGRLLYPVVEGIAVMIVDEAIPVSGEPNEPPPLTENP